MNFLYVIPAVHSLGLQPFATFIEYGCNGWRNWHDIQCNWKSLSSLIDHWGDYGALLKDHCSEFRK